MVLEQSEKRLHECIILYHLSTQGEHSAGIFHSISQIYCFGRGMPSADALPCSGGSPRPTFFSSGHTYHRERRYQRRKRDGGLARQPYLVGMNVSWASTMPGSNLGSHDNKIDPQDAPVCEISLDHGVNTFTPGLALIQLFQRARNLDLRGGSPPNRCQA